MDGHPLILGRPWLATTDACIAFQIGNMTISRGDSIKKIIIYPPAKPSLPTVKIHKHPHTYWEQNIHSPLTIVEALELKDQTEDDVINNFMNQPSASENLKCQLLKTILEEETQEDLMTNLNDQHIPTISICNNIPVEIEPGKILNINGSLDSD